MPQPHEIIDFNAHELAHEARIFEIDRDPVINETSFLADRADRDGTIKATCGCTSQQPLRDVDGQRYRTIIANRIPKIAENLHTSLASGKIEKLTRKRYMS